MIEFKCNQGNAEVKINGRNVLDKDVTKDTCENNEATILALNYSLSLLSDIEVKHFPNNLSLGLGLNDNWLTHLSEVFIDRFGDQIKIYYTQVIDLSLWKNSWTADEYIKKIEQSNIDNFKIFIERSAEGIIDIIFEFSENIVNKLSFSTLYENHNKKLTNFINTIETSLHSIKHETKIFCEGKTDYLHIERALEYFRERGEYLDLNIVFSKESGISGDKELLQYCNNVRRTANQAPIICIFDDDNRSITKQVTDSSKNYKYWSNNVYSIITPRPKHRVNDDSFCIEMYYTDEVLNLTNSHGRKIYKRSDFNRDNGFHKKDNVFCLYPKKATLIVDSGVISIESRNNIALSKSDFAELIYNKKEPYCSVEFEAFRVLLDLIFKIHLSSIDSNITS